MPVDHLEGRQQSLTALAVQLVDSLAQAGDGAGQVRLLGAQGFQPLGVPTGLLLGPQVHGAQGLALAFEIVEMGLDAAGFRRDGHGLIRQGPGEILRLDAGGLANLAGDLGQALAGGLQAGVEPGPALANLGGRGLCGANLAGGLRALGLGRGQGVGRSGPASLGLAQFGQQGLQAVGMGGGLFAGGV